MDNPASSSVIKRNPETTEMLNLWHLSLILDQDLVVIPEDIQKYKLSEQLKEKHAAMEPTVGMNPSALIPPAEQDKPEKEYAEKRIKIAYEGNFQKGILILFQGQQLEDLHREFLMKILGAVGCSLKDVALVPAENIQNHSPSSIDELNPHKCLVFGTISHSIMTYKTASYETIPGETEYFFADDLENLANSTDLKRKLWKGLQILFNINK